MRTTLKSLCRCLAAVALLAPAIAAAAKLETRRATAEEVGKTVACTVMNSEFKVTKDTLVIDYQGKPYYFCCDSCVSDFRKAPEKFAKKAAVAVRAPKAEEIGKAATCAVSKSELSVVPTTPVIDYQGKPYYFCCDRCVKDFRKNPGKYAMR